MTTEFHSQAASRLNELAQEYRTRAKSFALPRELGLQGILGKDVLNRILGQRFYVPFSERVHNLFAPVVLKQLPGISDFDDLFEFLGALIVTDDMMASGEGSVGGWFGKWAFEIDTGRTSRRP
jgi:hypothetical protein